MSDDCFSFFFPLATKPDGNYEAYMSNVGGGLQSQKHLLTFGGKKSNRAVLITTTKERGSFRPNAGSKYQETITAAAEAPQAPKEPLNGEAVHHRLPDVPDRAER